MLTFTVQDKREKTTIIISISGAVILTLPFLMTHLEHVWGFLHEVLHAVGFTLATFLTVLGYFSWRKTKILRVGMATCAFGLLSIAQIAELSLRYNSHIHSISLEDNLFDILIIVVVILFGVGVLGDRKN